MFAIFGYILLCFPMFVHPGDQVNTDSRHVLEGRGGQSRGGGGYVLYRNVSNSVQFWHIRIYLAVNVKT